jgi:hypothetical protein
MNTKIVIQRLAMTDCAGACAGSDNDCVDGRRAGGRPACNRRPGAWRRPWGRQRPRWWLRRWIWRRSRWRFRWGGCRPCVRTGWRNGQPDPRYRRNLAAWHLVRWFPGRNLHGRHGARVPRTQSGAGWQNRDDGERHDMLGHGESVIGNVRLEHNLRRRRTGWERERSDQGQERNGADQECFRSITKRIRALLDDCVQLKST